MWPPARRACVVVPTFERQWLEGGHSPTAPRSPAARSQTRDPIRRRPPQARAPRLELRQACVVVPTFERQCRSKVGNSPTAPRSPAARSPTCDPIRRRPPPARGPGQSRSAGATVPDTTPISRCTVVTVSPADRSDSTVASISRPSVVTVTLCCVIAAPAQIPHRHRRSRRRAAWRSAPAPSTVRGR